jgi:hypothetical protein
MGYIRFINRKPINPITGFDAEKFRSNVAKLLCVHRLDLADAIICVDDPIPD